MNTHLIQFLTVLFLLFAPTSISAKTKHWSSLHSLTRNFTIDKVKTTSKSTDVYFTVTAGKGKMQQLIFVTDFCKIIDIKGKDHPLLSVKGVRKGETVLKEGQKKKFRLSFTPLGANDSIFDIVTGQGPRDFFRFFGVHQESTELPSFISKAPPVGDDEKLHQTPFDAKKKYPTCIMGHLDDPYRRIKQISLTVLDVDSPLLSRVYKSDVDSSGFFMIQAEIHAEEHTYLYNVGLQTYIPVYLFPNDTLLCNVTKYRTPNQTCHYKSLNHTVPDKLLQHDPIYPLYELILEDGDISSSREKQLEVLRNAEKEIRQFTQYLGWKYQLRPDEQNLLYINDLARIEYNRLKVDKSPYKIPQELKDPTVLFACHNSMMFLYEIQQKPQEERQRIEQDLPGGIHLE